MYNRYIPQSDGSFRRSQIPDPCPVKPVPLPLRKEPAITEPEKPPNHNTPIKPPKPHHYGPKAGKYHAPNPEPVGSGISGFLRQLLPKDFDSSDLLVILLLLLMADDSEENQSTALLTMALYLFL